MTNCTELITKIRAESAIWMRKTALNGEVLQMTNELLAENSLLKEKIAMLEKERDAAIDDMSTLIIGNRFARACEICKCGFGEDPCQCLECDEVRSNGNFEWRGITDGRT